MQKTTTALAQIEPRKYTDEQEAAFLQAFPLVDPGHRPFGYRVLVQLRTPKHHSDGGIALIPEARETEKWNTQVALVMALGPVAYKNRDTLRPWPEGDWCKPGMFVRVPKYGADSWEVPVEGRDDKALFAMFKDLDIGGEVTCDPMKVIAFYD
jgi:co-chaperonin GroES (HSP10)